MAIKSDFNMFTKKFVDTQGRIQDFRNGGSDLLRGVHLSPMCQGQISFQKKVQTHPSFNACSCYMKVSKGSNQKQQRKSGNTIFPIMRSIGVFLSTQGQLTP